MGVKMIDIADISLAKESVEEADLRQVGAQLHAALSQIGFAYIKNHGIPMAWFESTFQGRKILSCSHGQQLSQ